MPAVLFVCTANRFRSPLAAAILEKALAEDKQEGNLPWTSGNRYSWEVSSAGIWTDPGEPALPDVQDAARQLGLDLSGHRSRMVSDGLLSRYDLILVMEQSHREALLREYPHYQERIYLLSHVVEYTSFDIPDSFNSLQEVLGVGVILNTLIRRGLPYICVLAVALHNRRVPN